MSVTSGAGSFPSRAVSQYGTPVYPSTLTASQWNPSAHYQKPGQGGVGPGGAANTQHDGSWKSEVPVEGQVRLVPGRPEWTRWIEAGDLLFVTIPPKSRQSRIQLDQMVAAFNQYTANAWLRGFHAAAMTRLASWSATELQEFLTRSEYAQSAKVEAKLKEMGENQSLHANLNYLTCATLLSVFTYLGINNTQTNELKSLDQRNGGNISASHGQPMAVFGARGPHRVRNVWGSNALPGRHLWYILKRWPQKVGYAPVDEDATDVQKALTWTAERPFQLVPYVADTWTGNIPDSERMYDGLGFYKDAAGSMKHFQERGHAIYVGQVVISSRRTCMDSGTHREAQGLATLNDDQDKVERLPPNNETSYEQMQALEYFTVQVNPQAFGSFVQLA